MPPVKQLTVALMKQYNKHFRIWRRRQQQRSVTSANKKKKKKTGISWAYLRSHFPLVIPSQASTAAAKQENKRHFRRTGVTEDFGGGVSLVSKF